VDNQLSKQASHLGSGWAFPVTFSAGNYQLQLSSYAENVNDSIHSILMTRMGERAMEPQFGSGLQQFFFRTMDDTLKGEIIDAIKVSLLHNEPRITVISVSADFIDLLTGLTEVTVTYMYNQANTRHNYVFPFHIKEGTNLTQ
jgi:phage baseplate assembly protein W